MTEYGKKRVEKEHNPVNPALFLGVLEFKNQFLKFFNPKNRLSASNSLMQIAGSRLDIFSFWGRLLRGIERKNKI